MKTYPDISKSVKQNILTGVIVLVALVGFNFQSNAQSISLGNDIDKINAAMQVQLANHDYDILIPKVSKEELNSIEDAKFNQLVYVAGAEPGYYFYMGTKWEKQNVREVFGLIDMNLAIQQPEGESLILTAEGADSKSLLDYNEHIKHIYQAFTYDKSDNSMAIHIEKE